MTKLDLMNQRFGRLTVIGRAAPYVSPKGQTAPRWHCRCDCGRELDVNQSKLTSHQTQSCGCTRGARAIDLTNKRFGRLVAIDRATNIDGKTRWNCICDCGNKCVVRSRLLISGKTTSCGCVLSEVAKKKAVEDNIFKHYDGTAIVSMGRKIGKNNKSGVTGVSWKTKDKRWEASIKLRGKSIYLGHFKTLEEAKAARLAGEERYYKPVIEAYKQQCTTTEP